MVSRSGWIVPYGFKRTYSKEFVENYGEEVVINDYKILETTKNATGESTDAEANAIIQGLYPEREVIGIMVNELWEDGRALHCVTQQQPKQ